VLGEVEALEWRMGRFFKGKIQSALANANKRREEELVG
jgi:hypothetical protein